MCLSKAYIDRQGNRELMMEDIASIKVEDNKLLFATLFGEQKEVEASIKQIDFLTHSILLKSMKEEGVLPKD